MKSPKISLKSRGTPTITPNKKPFTTAEAPNGWRDEVEDVRDQRPLQLPREVGPLGHVDPRQKEGGDGAGQGPHEEKPLEVQGTYPNPKNKSVNLRESPWLSVWSRVRKWDVWWLGVKSSFEKEVWIHRDEG